MAPLCKYTLNDGFKIPYTCPDGTVISYKLIESVYERLLDIEKETERVKESEVARDALTVLFHACVSAEKGEDRYRIEDGDVVDFLKRRNILVEDKIDLKLVIVANCLRRYPRSGKVCVIPPMLNFHNPTQGWIEQV